MIYEICEPCRSHVTYDDGTTEQVRVWFCYDPADPHACHVEFTDLDQTQRVGWVFARELLAAGLHRPVGIGDVQVQPLAGDHQILLRLNGNEGVSTVMIPRSVVARFVDRAYRMVPEEYAAMGRQVTAAITRILATATT